ncbi:MAG: hypothetical protein AAGJ46_19445 [Planctomycetota bacterium]
MNAPSMAYVALAVLLGAHAAANETDVIAVARGFPDGGTYNKAWRGTGTPEEVAFRGQRILSKGDGTYCCGFTFAVAMRVAEARGLLGDATVGQVRSFQKAWYGATRENAERQCADAVQMLGIGEAIPLSRAKPGDFVQFWRQKSGHSVVLLELIEEGGAVVGFRYRSSQGRTDGVGDHTEYFSDAPQHGGSVNRARFYAARLHPPKSGGRQ